MKKYLYIIGLFIFTTLPTQSKLNKADKLFENKAYTKAASLYNEFFQEKSDVAAPTLLQAADANFFIENNREALMLYQKAYQLNTGLDAPYVYRYYQCLRSVRDYEKADHILLTYYQKKGNTNAYAAYQKALQEFQKIHTDTSEVRFQLTNLNINTEYSEFSPVIYQDKVIFSSSRPGASKELYSWNEQPYLSLFIADKDSKGQLQDVRVFSKQVSSDFHDATIAVQDSSKTVFFATSNVEKNKLILDGNRNNNFELYKGVLEDLKITKKEPLFFNSKEYSVGHPAISPDGKYLYFASDMPGGYGGADLYYCEIFEDGMISNPKNLGGKINTWGNDFFPHLNNGNLYFASDGHLGFGGLDLYEAKMISEGDFSAPKNLGKVVNSSFDDFAIYFNSEGTAGYVSSNRANGKGDDDLYYFTRKPLTCDQYVYGNVKDQKDNSNLMAVTISVKDSIGNAYKTTLTDSLGNFKVKVPCKFKTTITATKASYFEKSQDVTTGIKDQELIGPINFILENAEDRISKDETGVEKIIMDPIFFNYDKAEITSQAALVLDKAVELMQFYPDMVIKIEAHTDSRGTASYNESLSDRRAKATRDYIFSKGISADRIVSAIGYGESRLLNKCKDGVTCSEEQHEENRRSDFIILKR